MTIYTEAISNLIQEVDIHCVWDDGYLEGLRDARDAVATAEEELQRRLPAIYEKYGVPLT